MRPRHRSGTRTPIRSQALSASPDVRGLFSVSADMVSVIDGALAAEAQKGSKFDKVSVGSHETASAEVRIQQDFAPLHSIWAAHLEWSFIGSLMRRRGALMSKAYDA